MRLLYTVTGQFIEIYNLANVEYAILSHTWVGNGREQTYQEVTAIQMRHQLTVLYESAIHDLSSLSHPTSKSMWNDCEVSPKIRRACEVALAEGYLFMWIDSCCIDKTSSSELSEAINSMFSWYRDASICYAYLTGVSIGDDPFSDGSEFSRCRWFTRGWTLQELIAPRVLVFLCEDWQVFGTKTGLARAIEKVTNIDCTVLTHQQRLDNFSVATRMCWASERTTTRVEDRAYSLLGIFDINMPTLYGEGDRAFLRLQEEILKRIPDQSIFVWGAVDFHADWYQACSPTSIDACNFEDKPMLASSPSQFRGVGRIQALPFEEFADRLSCSRDDLPYPTYSSTPFGLHTHFPVVTMIDCLSQEYLGMVPNDFFRAINTRCRLAILACEPVDRVGYLFALVCHLSRPPHMSLMDVKFKRDRTFRWFRAVLLPPQLHVKAVCVETVYTRLTTRSTSDPLLRTPQIDYSNILSLTQGSNMAFERAGYKAVFSHENEHSYALVLSRLADRDTAVKLVFHPVPGSPSFSVYALISHSRNVIPNRDSVYYFESPTGTSSPSSLFELSSTDSKQIKLSFKSGLSLTMTCVTTTGLRGVQLDVDMTEEWGEPEGDGASSESSGTPTAEPKQMGPTVSKSLFLGRHLPRLFSRERPR